MHKVIHKICGANGSYRQNRAPARAAGLAGRALPVLAGRADAGLAGRVRGAAHKVIHKMNSRESAPGGASGLCWQPGTPKLRGRRAGPAAKSPDETFLVLKPGALRHLLDRARGA